MKKKGNKAKKGDESHVPGPIHPYYQYQLTPATLRERGMLVHRAAIHILSILSSNIEIGDREWQT